MLWIKNTSLLRPALLLPAGFLLILCILLIYSIFFPSAPASDLLLSDQKPLFGALSLNTANVLTGGVNIPPTALINANPVVGNAPHSVTLNGSGSTDIDGVIADYHWSFGDGQSGAGISAVHDYVQVGLYEVVLTVTDNSGATGTQTTFINVGVDSGANNPPVAVFNALPDSGVVPLEVIFDASDSADSDGTIASYNWDFGDNQSGSGMIVSHSYGLAGSYTVTLTVTDNDLAASTYSKNITAAPSEPDMHPPIAFFNAQPSQGYVPLTVDFDASGSTDSDGVIINYAWDFGDGHAGTGMETSHQYTSPAIYVVTLTVTDNDSLTNTYSATISAGEESSSPSPEPSPTPQPSNTPSPDPSPSPSVTVSPTITPVPQNQPPSFEQILPQEVEVGEDLVLEPRVTDDGLPDPPAALAYYWSKRSGPGAVSFSDQTSPDTSAVFQIEGEYELILDIYDGEHVVSMVVEVKVQQRDSGAQISIPGNRQYSVRPGGTVTIPVVVTVRRPSLAGYVFKITSSVFEFILE